MTPSCTSVPDSLVTCVPRIGTLTSLTKLHISTADSLVIDFQPLSQLTQLIELGLQCMTKPASCTHVLCSSRKTLRRVVLIALSWDIATYTSLGCLGPPIDVSIRVATLQEAEARALSSVPANTIHLALTSKVSIPLGYSLHRTLNQLTMRPLACICHLTLHGITDDNCLALHKLHHLQSLAFVQSSLTGSSLRVQRSVTVLAFIACCDITAAGIKHITTTAFANLRMFPSGLHLVSCIRVC